MTVTRKDTFCGVVNIGEPHAWIDKPMVINYTNRSCGFPYWSLNLFLEALVRDYTTGFNMSVVREWSCK